MESSSTWTLSVLDRKLTYVVEELWNGWHSHLRPAIAVSRFVNKRWISHWRHIGEIRADRQTMHLCSRKLRIRHKRDRGKAIASRHCSHNALIQDTVQINVPTHMPNFPVGRWVDPYANSSSWGLMAIYLRRIGKREDTKCWWCGHEHQTWDHLFKWCKRWKRE
jgi:hypothetical protein